MFFTVGPEVRREFAIGELTSWSRAMLAVAAAIAGQVMPALLFVLILRGSGNEYPWGVVISTDTAFLASGAHPDPRGCRDRAPCPGVPSQPHRN
ncbi:Na+/H+ antiporter NhaA [Dactylosporangium darangshiense]|uniref:Na+/H+ antiporter NhaA n=1 Tax=Dactylosporangium darangshiense TaxID=579108 RepID=UPI003CD06F1D